MAWKNFNIKNISIFILSCFLCTILIFFSTSFLFFPNHIQFKDENNKTSLSAYSNEKYNKLDYIEVNSLIEDGNTNNKSSNLSKINILDTHLNISNSNIIDKEVIPIGMTVGVCINTDGIMVLGVGYVNGEDQQAYKPSEGILQPGDLIIKANDKQLIKKEDLMKVIEESTSNVNLIIKRDNNIIETSVSPIKSFEEKVNKIGIWVRDSTQGIGTITYYNPVTNKFGALGHGILDVDTKKIMSVNDGEIMESEIVSIQKGEKGSPGELVGNIEKKNIIGKIKTNTKFGLYGYLDPKSFKNINKQSIPIGLQNDIHEGSAKILSNIEGSTVKEYNIVIESINKFSSDDSKGMIIKITDKELLSKTNGIVQGMSGSPIIQSGKLIGAVTHVFVQDPTKGYGIFIENMLKQDKSI